MGRLTALASRPWVRGLLRVHWLLQSLTRGHAGVYVYALCAQPLTSSETPPRAGPRPETTKIRSVAPSDPIVSEFKRPAEVTRQRFDAGARCYVATVNDSFAGHIWVAFGAYDEDEVRCRYVMPLQARGVWDFDVYVAPDYRLTRVLARLWSTASDDLYGQGYRWTFSRISLFSRRSIATHERLGARPVGHVAFLVLGGLQIGVQRGPWSISVSTRRRPGPTIELRAPAVAAATDKPTKNIPSSS